MARYFIERTFPIGLNFPTAIGRLMKLSGLVLAVAIGASPGIAGAHSDGGELAAARAATARFHDAEAALADGRFILADLAGLTCIEDPGGAGGMGEHYVDPDLVGDGVIDVTQPEVLLYDPSTPEPRLLGVEYVVFVADWAEEDPPMLFGHQFHLVEAGNRYGLPAFYERDVRGLEPPRRLLNAGSGAVRAVGRCRPL